MKRKIRTYSGTMNPAVSERELKNRAVARKAAADGIVLLKNDGVLPMEKGSKVALFGSGAGQTIKGGTGSGVLYSRSGLNISQRYPHSCYIVIDTKQGHGHRID